VATSGSWNYSRTAAELIQAALENIGVYSTAETLSGPDQALALSRLNMMVKAMSGRIDLAPGLKIHTRQRVTLFLAKGQQTYLVGPASTDARATTQYGRTTISAAEAVGQTTISITSNTDTTTYPGTTVTMTASDIVGIELNDGTIQWTTISGTPGATMTIADSLTVAAAAGNYVWWFTSRAQRFVELEAATLIDENRNETSLGVYREVQAYDAGVADKYSDGDPTTILVEPLRITTRVILDSQPTDVTKQIQLTCLYPSEDYDSITDDIAFPQECFDFLSWELGFRCAPAFHAEWTPVMEANRKEAMLFARNLNPETTDAHFRPGGL
jgi:hypothetical protein